MSLEVEVIYEDGVLKPGKPLPLHEGQRVKVTVHEATSRIRASYGLIGWTGAAEVLRRIAEDDRFSVMESP
jgi:predicted DNA-binding antitoxin AbrB/MazE fold protein